jgi:hypothetical protein
MSIKIISQAIADKLQPLVTQGKVQTIEQFSSGTVIGYPRIQILFVGVTTDYLTNQEQIAEYKFNIVISQEITIENITPEDGTEISYELTQDVIVLLNQEVNSQNPLSNTIDFVRPITETQTLSIEELPLITQVVTINCVKTL